MIDWKFLKEKKKYWSVYTLAYDYLHNEMDKTIVYTLIDGTKKEVTYNPNWPCINCGLPVISPSMGGTVLCSWCDTGRYRFKRFDNQELGNQISPMEHLEHRRFLKNNIREYKKYFQEFDIIVKRYPYIKQHISPSLVKEILSEIELEKVVI